MKRTNHNHPTYWAFLLHRISGVLLGVFVPVHLYVLSLAVSDGAFLDRFLGWSSTPLMKVLETGMVVMLAAHLTGGLRLLGLEFLAWYAWQKTAVALSVGISLAIGLVFFLNAD
jgi:fumarate reductase subunit D